MRILIVDVNFDYKNPMYRQFYTALFDCMEVDFFGPGYVSRECLEKGIDYFMTEHGAYDAVLLGNYFVYSSNEKGARYNAYHVHRHTLPYYNVNDAYQCCRKIYEDLIKLDHIIKVFLYYEDMWSVPVGDRDICHRLLEHGFYILSWPIEYMENWPAKSRNKNSTRSNYAYEIARKYSDCYIPIPLHAIGYHEIFVRNFYDRDYEWCIPGNRMKKYYPEREKAHEMIQKGKRRVWKDDPYQLLSVETIHRKHIEWYKFHNNFEKFLSVITGKNDYIASQPQMRYIAACREHYLESMRASRIVYAESGIVDVFVRKYFEACACGAVLTAKRVPGMREMGFLHDQNCIIVERYEEIKNIDHKYSTKRLEKIAKAGQKLILDKHMFAHRAKILRSTLESIMQGRYKGAYWKDGDYFIKF